MTGDLVLSARTLDRLPASVARPGPRSGEAPGIVHLGAGAFHRAHQAVHTEEAGDGWGILAVSPRNPAAAEALSTQDGYFSVTEQDGHGSRLGVVGSIVSALALPGREAELTAAVAAPSTRVVTLTITEQGYADRSVLRHLLTGLLARLDAGGEPLAIVACDNLRNADRLLPRALDELARELDPGRYRALADYLGTVGFPSSVVDRITPATSPDDLAAVAARLGVADRAAVVTEPYRMWVLTDEFPAGRPKWENAGVSFVAEVEPYEQRKLRLLNGTHSALAYLGQLGDHATIADAVADPWCAGFARALAATDLVPALTARHPDIEAGQYLETTLARFANPALRHTTEQVSRDGSRKLPLRLLDTVRERLAAGAVPVHTITVVAAWLAFARHGRSDSGRALAVTDPELFRLRGADLPAVCALLGAADLAEDPRFLDVLGEQLALITRHGARAAVADLL